MPAPLPVGVVSLIGAPASAVVIDQLGANAHAWVVAIKDPGGRTGPTTELLATDLTPTDTVPKGGR